MSKEKVRKETLAARKAISTEELMDKSDSVTEKLLSTDLYKNANTIMAYIDFRNEVRTEKIIKTAIADGKRIVIPISIVETRQLVLSEIINYDSELTAGAYGILEPLPEYLRETDPETVDLVLIPGVAFDERGYRVGYGAGYYDRFLEKVREDTSKIALAFELQMVDYAHEDSHDVPVDLIVTEDRIVKCVR